MVRLPTPEEDAAWTPHGDGCNDASHLEIVVGPAGAFGKRKVVAKLGNYIHPHTFDPFDQTERKKFRDAVVSKFYLSEDAHEFIESKLLAGAESSPQFFKPVITMLDTVPAQKDEWLWTNRIAIGKNNLLLGNPGLGKSLVALHIAAITTRNCVFPDSPDKSCEPGGVVILTLEDDAADTLVPRLLDHNADLSRIAHVKGLTDTDSDGKAIYGIDLLRDIEAVGAACDQVKNCRLLIIDTISDYLGEKTDTHKNRDIRAVLNPLAALANDRRIANLCVSHLRKSEGAAIHAAIGSVGFIGQSRVAWMFTRCPTNPRRRLMTCVKNNLADDTTGLALCIEPYGNDGGPVVCWETEPLCMSADEAIAATQKKRGPAPKERDDAAAWLSQKLANGPQPAGVILDEAEGLGYSDSTVRRAFKQLECETKKGGFDQGWLWSLPEDVTEDVTDALHPNNLVPSHLRKNTEENNIEPTYLSCSRTKVPDCLDPKAPHTFEEFEAERQQLNGQGDVPF